jgi:energy-coupling factor transporter ATP-binding protein EcfA2
VIGFYTSFLFLGLRSMPSLSIRNFSCIKSADFTLKPINVIIGAQGSGKSVTIKLFNFFSNILNAHTGYAQDGFTFDDYKKIISYTFCDWFPPSAWGNFDFRIFYKAADFTVECKRNEAGNSLIIIFSDWFNEIYDQNKKIFAELESSDSNNSVNTGLDHTLTAMSLINKQLYGHLQSEFINEQTFIPAGRAFFTSIGKLVSAFSQEGLDVLTVRFARLLSKIQDRNIKGQLPPLDSFNQSFNDRRDYFMNNLIGGEIVFENEQGLVSTEDGRKTPFANLSSAQQEILPIFTILDSHNRHDVIAHVLSKDNKRQHLLFIEEPETHLFPKTQSKILEFLVSSTTPFESNKLIITTHSPYLMVKLNVFLKAGQLSKHIEKQDEISKIVPRDCWLTEDQLAVYCIKDGVLESIIDKEDGLIDADYLDQISETISEEFTSLLEIESEI